MTFDEIKILSAVHAHSRPILSCAAVKIQEDPDVDLSWLDTDDAVDQERLAGYGRDWHSVCVRVEAVIHVPHVGPSLSFRAHSLCSAGLWGVESDVSQEYVYSIAVEEWQQLRDELEKMNVVIPDSIRAQFEMQAQSIAVSA